MGTTCKRCGFKTRKKLVPRRKQILKGLRRIEAGLGWFGKEHKKVEDIQLFFPGDIVKISEDSPHKFTGTGEAKVPLFIVSVPTGRGWFYDPDYTCSYVLSPLFNNSNGIDMDQKHLCLVYSRNELLDMLRKVS